MIHGIIENNTRNMDSHTPLSYTNTHTLGDGKGGKSTSCLGLAVRNYKQPFIKNCLSDFQNMILFPVCLSEFLKRINLHCSQKDIGFSRQCSHVELGREDTDSLGKNSLRRFQFVKSSPLCKRG